jgi:glutaredoxin
MTKPAYTIYSQQNYQCPFCERAAALLDQKGLPYQLRALHRDELLPIAKKAGMSTVPIIYLGDELIGGASELEKHLTSQQK